jgi:hypothetical protein
MAHVTTKDMAEVAERIQAAKLNDIQSAMGAGTYAFNLAISQIDQAIRNRDDSVFNVLADLLTTAYLDKALIAVSASNTLPTQDKASRTYMRTVKDLNLKHVVDFADGALGTKEGQGAKKLVIEANMEELRRAHRVCSLLRGSKDINLLVGAINALVERSDEIRNLKGNVVDIAFSNLFAGIGEEIGAMASARTNYLVAQLYALQETVGESTQRYIKKTLNSEMISAFDENSSGDVIFDIVKNELGTLREMAITSLAHMLDSPNLKGKNIEFGDGNSDIDESGKSLSQLPVIIDGEGYDILMEFNLKDWTLRESLIFMPFNIQFIEKDTGLMAS